MEAADVALVIALDGSASVTYDEFGLLTGGLGAAFADADVAKALTGGPHGASLLSVLLWSGAGAHEVIIPWTRVSTTGDLAAFAQAVADLPRIVRAGETAIGEALVACETLFVSLPASVDRRIIDVAGDGRSNAGIPPEPVRDRLVQAGVTINGLCVLHEEPDLLQSYTEEVIGGPGAFAITCFDYQGFAVAVRRKLVQEVS